MRRDSGHGLGAVLLDYIMPNMSGIEVLAEIREHDKNIPIIFSSGFEQAQISGQDAFVTYLRTPYTLAALSDHLRKVLASNFDDVRVN